MLGQNPDKHPQHLVSSKVLNTIIKNAHIMFLPMAGRWLIPIELLFLQAYPAYKVGSDVEGMVCSFSVHRRRCSRAAVAGQAGNSFSVNQIGCIIMCAAGRSGGDLEPHQVFVQQLCSSSSQTAQHSSAAGSLGGVQDSRTTMCCSLLSQAKPL